MLASQLEILAGERNDGCRWRGVEILARLTSSISGPPAWLTNADINNAAPAHVDEEKFVGTATTPVAEHPSTTPIPTSPAADDAEDFDRTTSNKALKRFVEAYVAHRDRERAAAEDPLSTAQPLTIAAGIVRRSLIPVRVRRKSGSTAPLPAYFGKYKLTYPGSPAFETFPRAVGLDSCRYVSPNQRRLDAPLNSPSTPTRGRGGTARPRAASPLFLKAYSPTLYKPRARSESPPTGRATAAIAPKANSSSAQKGVLRPRARSESPPPVTHMCSRGSHSHGPTVVDIKPLPSWMFAPRVGVPRQRSTSPLSRTSSRRSSLDVASTESLNDVPMAAHGPVAGAEVEADALSVVESEEVSASEGHSITESVVDDAEDSFVETQRLAPNGTFTVEARTDALFADIEQQIGFRQDTTITEVLRTPFANRNVGNFEDGVGEVASPHRAQSIRSDVSSQWLSPNANHARPGAMLGACVSPMSSTASIYSELSESRTWASLPEMTSVEHNGGVGSPVPTPAQHVEGNGAEPAVSPAGSVAESSASNSSKSFGDLSSSPSLGPLTPSHSVLNLAGAIGKGLPSSISAGSVARLREGPPNSLSGLTLSSTQSVR